MQHAGMETAPELSALTTDTRRGDGHVRLQNIDSYRSDCDHRVRSAGLRGLNGIELTIDGIETSDE